MVVVEARSQSLQTNRRERHRHRARPWPSPAEAVCTIPCRNPPSSRPGVSLRVGWGRPAVPQQQGSGQELHGHTLENHKTRLANSSLCFRQTNYGSKPSTRTGGRAHPLGPGAPHTLFLSTCLLVRNQTGRGPAQGGAHLCPERPHGRHVACCSQGLCSWEPGNVTDPSRDALRQHSRAGRPGTSERDHGPVSAGRVARGNRSRQPRWMWRGLPLAAADPRTRKAALPHRGRAEHLAGELEGTPRADTEVPCTCKPLAAELQDRVRTPLRRGPLPSEQRDATGSTPATSRRGPGRGCKDASQDGKQGPGAAPAGSRGPHDLLNCGGAP